MQSDLFQKVDDGSIPISPLQFLVRECRFKDIRDIFERFHYKKSHMGGGISFCLSLNLGEIVWGGGSNGPS